MCLPKASLVFSSHCVSLDEGLDLPTWLGKSGLDELPDIIGEVEALVDVVGLNCCRL